MKNQNFDDLMASMGVRKLDRGEKRKSTSSAVPNKLRTKTRKAGAPLSTSPKKDLSPELATLRLQIDALKKELASTQSRLEEQAKAFSEAKESSERAQMDLSKARQDIERLEAEVTVWNGESDAGEGLLASLSRRGLKGEDERRDALMALGKRRELDALLKRLKVVEPSMVQRQLARRLVLCCGQEGCETAAGVATIVVGPNRCEVCGGQPIEEHVRRFVSGLLNMGWRRCTIYGGPDWAAKAVQNLAQHSRLEIQLVPWSTISSHVGLQIDSEADCVVLWRTGGGPVEDWMNGCPESVKSVNSKGKTLTQMFQHAGSAILNID